MFDAEIVGCVNMTLVGSIIFKSYAKGSFHQSPERNRTGTQKSQLQGAPRGWQIVAEADPTASARWHYWSGAQRSAAQQSFQDLLHTAATGHTHTRGEDVILYLQCA